MPTSSFDKKFIIEDIPENEEIIKAIKSETLGVALTGNYTPMSENEKEEFIKELLKSRNWD